MADQVKAQPLRGKTVLVTGASRGIGAAAAKRLAQAGASVVVNYNQNKEAALGVLQEIEKNGARGMVFQADVTLKDQVDAMVAAAREKLSAVDILINNAYFPFQVGPLHELPWEKVKAAVEHELSAFHYCVKACLPGMLEKKAGKIIVVSTRLAQQPLPKLGAYAAAKSALESMADTMA
ncbi:MAG: SDR family NAD(P)-dependent oxidoreductase, partial [Deltaproteobacteria bacterium]|nr:SDR family NAD(P)-dependent oxidoreductase [Deltaproteobacteria bacterium]